MLPYIHLPDRSLGPIPIHWFGILVAIGVLIGIQLARWRAGKLGVDLARLESFISWLLAGGFLGGHMLDEIFYHPDVLAARPWTLLFLWEGLSSFGGFIGASIGILLWKRYRGHGQAILPLADLILSVFPIAWVFGRSGCAVVHDHPGMRASASSIFAVAYPGGARYDLGLLEAFYAVILSAVVALLWRRKTPVGTYVVITCLAYAPVRFGLDFLRITDGQEADRRYLGLTPAQWACVALLAFGIAVLVRMLNQRTPAGSKTTSET